MEYEQMLERAIAKMPESVHEKERFEIPKVVGHLEGNKTIISNFLQIASALRRESEHVLKYLLRELATPGEVRRSFLVLGAKVGSAKINEKILQYAEEFVFCPSCGKPDTDLKHDRDFTMLVCSACGNRTPVKSKI